MAEEFTSTTGLELDVSWDLHSDSNWFDETLVDAAAATRWTRSGHRFEGDPITIVSIVVAAKYTVDLLESIIRRSRKDVLIDLRKNAVHVQRQLSSRNGLLIIIDSKGVKVIHDLPAKDALTSAAKALLRMKTD